MTQHVFIKFWLQLGSLALCLLLPYKVYALTPSCSVDTTSSEVAAWLSEHTSQHPAVLAAKAAVEASEFQKEAASKPLYNPELEWATESIDESRTTTIGISQTVDWAGRGKAVAKQSLAGLNVSNKQLHVAEQDIAMQLLRALSEYHTHEEQQALANQRSQLMKRFVTLATLRFVSGDLTQLDIEQAKLSYAQARFTQTNEKIGYIQSKQQLIALIGTEHLSWPAMPLEFPKPRLPGDTAGKVQQLPEMLLALAAVELAQATIKQQLSHSSANPTFSIQAGKEESADVLGLTFSMPLHVRNSFKAEISAANSQMIQAEKQAHSVFRELTRRHDVAVASYRLRREAWLFWRQFGAATLSDQINLLERLWKAGELSTTDYLAQLNQALQTKTAAIQQRGQLWKDWAQWQLATGQIKRCLLTAMGSEK